MNAFLRTLLVVLASVFSAVASAQEGKPGKLERREMKSGAIEAKTEKAEKRTADDAQDRIMAKLREQFDVSDDAEWNLIAERIATVTELRRNLSGAASIRGSATIGDKVKRNSRTAVMGFQEQAALRSAVRDKLPDAEIKARLARMHDVHQQNEAKLAKAQQELRAVLTVRQEAVAVVAGLLPP